MRGPLLPHAVLAVAWLPPWPAWASRRRLCSPSASPAVLHLWGQGSVEFSGGSSFPGQVRERFNSERLRDLPEATQPIQSTRPRSSIPAQAPPDFPSSVLPGSLGQAGFLEAAALAWRPGKEGPARWRWAAPMGGHSACSHVEGERWLTEGASAVEVGVGLSRGGGRGSWPGGGASRAGHDV